MEAFIRVVLRWLPIYLATTGKIPEDFANMIAQDPEIAVIVLTGYTAMIEWWWSIRAGFWKRVAEWWGCCSS